MAICGGDRSISGGMGVPRSRTPNFREVSRSGHFAGAAATTLGRGDSDFFPDSRTISMISPPILDL